MTRRRGDIRRRIDACLSQGPATTGEIAADTGYPLRNLTGYMHMLRRRGLVQKRPHYRHGPGPGPRNILLWSLTPALHPYQESV